MIHTKSANACRICGMPRTDPVSIETGAGPICRVTAKMREVNGRQQDRFGNERSTYTYEVRGDIVCVTDHDLGRTVTKDAERVVEDLVECLGTLAAKRLIYCDTRGIWDEIVARGDLFSAFRSIKEVDLADALEKVIREHVQTACPAPVTLDQFIAGAAPVEVAQVTTDMRGNIKAARLL